MTQPTASSPRVLQVGPIPTPTDNGTSAYLEGILASPLAGHYTFSTFDVRLAAGPGRSPMRWWVALPQLGRFARQLRRGPVDLVHLHVSARQGLWENLLLARWAAHSNTAYVLHMHGRGFETVLQSSGWRQRWIGGILSGAAAVVVSSEASKRRFSSWVEPQRLQVLPLAITVPHVMRVARQQGPVRIVVLGALGPRQGLDELVLASARLVQDGVRNFHVDLVGGEQSFGEAVRSRKAFRKLGLDGWATFHVPKSGAETQAFLQQADVKLSTIDTESIGIGDLQALAHGVPVVSSCRGAVVEYVTHGEQGLLFEPHDVDGLYSALRQLIEDAALRARLSAAARQWAQRYDWQLLWKELDRVYRCALGASR